MPKVFAAHDHIFKLLLELPGVARVLLSERLPAALRERLEDEEPQPVPADFVRRALKEIRADLLFRQRLRGGRACLYTLIEHKSGRDDGVGYQLLGYLSAGWRDLRQQSRRIGCARSSFRSSSTTGRRNGACRAASRAAFPSMTRCGRCFSISPSSFSTSGAAMR
ncbi:MAG: Rpn family recombination-promoting nuclease/putative transposase [Myxococcales bacterium]|jgi:hypothetical protein